ncbi:MAG: hypothetical protein IH891_07535 [Planctomycetes bacterium]|nr:hypothetical protein [Planctomycetota bacterium]
MRRVWVLIFLACLAMLLPRAASAQSVELSFLVNEDSFKTLVDDLELQGAAIDDARALWGPYYFNLVQGYETYLDYIGWPETGRHPALTQYWRIHDYGRKGRPEWDRLR